MQRAEFEARPRKIHTIESKQGMHHTNVQETNRVSNTDGKH